MHKNIHRQCLNVVVANSRGAARSYGKEYGFDFDCWDRQYWFSYHPRGVWHGLQVYFHSGAAYILDEIPAWCRAQKAPSKWGEVWLEFCRYVRMHPPRGEQRVRIAIMRGLGDEWNRVAGPSASWEAGKWLPVELEKYRNRPLKEPADHKPLPQAPPKWRKAIKRAGEKGKPQVEDTYLWDYILLNLLFANYGLPWRTNTDRLCTGTPYGPVDFVPWDAPLERLREYQVVAFLGHGIVTKQTVANLCRYVEGGGQLVIAAGQLRGERGELLTRQLMGVRLGQERQVGELPYTYLEPTSPKTEVVYRLPNNDPMVVRARHGKGSVFVFSGEWLTYFNEWVPTKILLPLLERAKWLNFEPASDWLEYMVQRKGKTFIFPLFNHGRGFYPSGNGRDYGAWKGQVTVGLSDLGLSRERVAVYRAIFRPERWPPFSLQPLKFSVAGDRLTLEVAVEELDELIVGPAATAKQDYFGRR